MICCKLTQKKEADVVDGPSELRDLPKVFQPGPRCFSFTIYAPGHPPTPSELRERAFFGAETVKIRQKPSSGPYPEPQILGFASEKFQKSLKKDILIFLRFYDIHRLARAGIADLDVGVHPSSGMNMFIRSDSG